MRMRFFGDWTTVLLSLAAGASRSPILRVVSTTRAISAARDRFAPIALCLVPLTAAVRVSPPAADVTTRAQILTRGVASGATARLVVDRILDIGGIGIDFAGVFTQHMPAPFIALAKRVVSSDERLSCRDCCCSWRCCCMQNEICA